MPVSFPPNVIFATDIICTLVYLAPQPGSFNAAMYPAYDAGSYPGYTPPPASGGATLEYSIISSILNPSNPSTSSAQNSQRPAPGNTAYVPGTSPPGLVTASWPSEPQYNAAGQSNSNNGFNGNGAPSTSYSDATGSRAADMLPPSVTETAAYMRLQNAYGPNASAPYGQTSSSGEGYDFQSGGQGQAPSSGSLPFTSPNTSTLSPYQRTRATPPSWSGANAMTTGDAGVPGGAGTTSYANGTAAVANIGGQLREASSVYKMVTKKYDYTEGYHFLMKHISCRCVFLS